MTTNNHNMNNDNTTPPPIAIVAGIPLRWQDSTLVVADKPANLLSVPGRGPDKQDCLINRLLCELPNARIVHRLDMATSGMLIIAQSHAAQRHLSQQFAARTVQKTYRAVVAGKLASTIGCIDLPLLCDWPNRPKQKVDHENGKAALTHYTVIDYDARTDTSHIELKPVTGRSHQLRVHMQALGHPILGDEFYAPATIAGASARLLLHAHKISFEHPSTQQRISLTSPCPF